MKIAVVGAGGIGGYFGGRWAEAGLDVTLIARGTQLDVIRNRGLAIKSSLGDATVPIKTAARAADVGVADLILIATKTWQLADALRDIEPMLGADSMVLGLQNGVETADIIGAAVGKERTLEGTVRIISFIDSPGVIKHAGGDPLITFGERSGQITARCEQVRDALARGRGMSIELTDKVEIAIWRKFHWFAPLAGIGSVTQATAGEFRSIPETRAMLIAAMNEVLALAHSRGVKIPDDSTDKAMNFVDSLPTDATSTMMRDFRDGKRTELETLTGAIVRMGVRYGVGTPVNAFMYGALLPREESGRRVGGVCFYAA